MFNFATIHHRGEHKFYMDAISVYVEVNGVQSIHVPVARTRICYVRIDDNVYFNVGKFLYVYNLNNRRLHVATTRLGNITYIRDAGTHLIIYDEVSGISRF